jgi:uncharacterized protein YqeY
MTIDKSKIPSGMYCYSKENGTYRPCPYWKNITDSKVPDIIWCEVMQRGDTSNLDENSFNKLVDAYESEDAVYEKYPYTMLWDQNKECGINDEIDEIDATIYEPI